VGIFEAEAFEVDFRISIGPEILILIGIEKQIGRVQDPRTVGHW
jgi:hypothetical protein